MNEMLENLFYDFLTNPTGDQVAELDKLQDDLTTRLEAGELDGLALAAFKVDAMQAGFAAGYAAAQKVPDGEVYACSTEPGAAGGIIPATRRAQQIRHQGRSYTLRRAHIYRRSKSNGKVSKRRG